MSHNADATNCWDKALVVVVLVGNESFRMGNGDVSKNRFGVITLPSDRGPRYFGINDQGIAVVYENVTTLSVERVEHCTSRPSRRLDQRGSNGSCE